ncbi:MAG: hypothetical protein QMD21_01980 [Candidatus Thermoplasmatota archaeon]|nr:hypothetical protein [Candidatus Thermoplasmatota archaeon]
MRERGIITHEEIKGKKYYVLIKHASEYKIKHTIIKLRKELKREPKLEEVALRLGKDYKDTNFRNNFFKAAKDLGWKPPKRWEYEYEDIIRVR